MSGSGRGTETERNAEKKATETIERQRKLSAEERIARGKAARVAAPRTSHADWEPSADRPDLVSVLKEQAATRLPELIAIRHGRMSVSPFTFYRGSAVVMADDLAGTPTSGIKAQICGDAHLSNFGVFGSPERRMLFDLNDFDETLPGPWEWDVKRMAASFVVGARAVGFPKGTGRQAAIASVESYRTRMAEYARMRDLDVWYSHVTSEEILAATTTARMRKRTEAAMVKARTKDSLQAFSKLATVVDGKPRIVDDPPLVVRVDAAQLPVDIKTLLGLYRRTLQDDRKHLLEQYEFVDLARKVVGVGSVGTRCFIALLAGRDDGDPLFLQVKEAQSSVLERHLPKSRFRNHGQRVVAGQRFMQASSDIFLGWIRGPGEVDYYWRQLRDMKGSAVVEEMVPEGYRAYAGLCGWALARAHARSGDRIAIAAYLGKSDTFANAVADFSEAYADQTERDHQTMLDAIAKGKIKSEVGV
jgi:uncharacterized protein (DUF2252 family)